MKKISFCRRAQQEYSSAELQILLKLLLIYIYIVGPNDNGINSRCVGGGVIIFL